MTKNYNAESEYPQSLYENYGYRDRNDYIESLKEEYGDELVDLMLTCLPPSEDFDGLPAMLEEASQNFYD